MPPLTPLESELSSLRSELPSIESLLENFFQWLDMLQEVAPSSFESLSRSDTPSPAVHPYCWASVCEEGENNFSVCTSRGWQPCPVSDYFALLEKLTELAATRLPAAPEQSASVRSNTMRKHQISLTTPDSLGKSRRRLSHPWTQSPGCTPPGLQASTHLPNGTLDAAVTSSVVISLCLNTQVKLLQSILLCLNPNKCD